jgi:sugar transferase (PEP-CTERM/EpsH1 system associated)
VKIKVLHVVLSLETGGLENGVVNLINHSDSNNFVVDVLCLREKGELASRVNNPHSQVIFDGNKDHSLKTAIYKIFQANACGQYHIIHTHGFSTMLAAYIANLIQIRNKPLLINGEHGTLYFETFKHRILQKFLFFKMSHNFTVSADLKQEIFNRFNIKKDNFTPIINGVDTLKFTPDQALAQPIRSELSLNKNDIIIGSVGRLVHVKNYKSLISAFASFSKSYPHAHLVLAGDGSERKALEAQIEQYNLNNKIHLLGRRDDIANIINALDVFVLPSYSEGLSNTLLEAMSCATPVIACNVGGNPEIIVEGKTGYLYESDNVDALSDLLIKLIMNPLLIKELSINSRQHIVENFSLNSMVRNYEFEYIRSYSQCANTQSLKQLSKQ